MDDNWKEIIILVVTSLTTLGLAWLRMRSPAQQQPPPPAEPPLPPVAP